MFKLKIYLAGSVNLTEYRKYVKETYGNDDRFEIIDPLEYEEWEVQEKGLYDKIIDTDCRLMKYCDILIADMSLGPTFGTVGEITLMKHLYNKPVFIFDVLDIHKNDPWLIGQATKVFENVDICFNYIKSLLEY
jgi:nucleoside 2-deoxyribosyltransferase